MLQKNKISLDDIKIDNDPKYEKCSVLLKVKQKKSTEHWLFIFTNEIKNDPIQLVRLITNNCLFNDLSKTRQKVNEGKNKYSNKRMIFLQLHANIFVVKGDRIAIDKLKQFVVDKVNRASKRYDSYIEFDKYVLDELNSISKFILKIDKKINKHFGFRNCNYLYLIYTHVETLLNSDYTTILNPKTYKIVKQLKDILKSYIFGYNLKRENRKYWIGTILTTLFSLSAFIVSVLALKNK